MQRLRTTLIIIYDEEKILLGLKKRGFGVNKWNGFGGKVKKEEDLLASAHRELYEECSVKCSKENMLLKRGVIDFYFNDKLDEVIEVNIFSIDSTGIIGKPQESQEMQPRWFLHRDIPYEKMWIDDQHWLPLLLEGENFTGRFLFANGGEKILEKNLRIV